MTTSATAPSAPTENFGRVTQIIGSTFNVEFAENQLPSIYNAVKITSERKGIKLNLTGEVQQHLGGGQGAVRRPGQHRRRGPRHAVPRHAARR